MINWGKLLICWICGYLVAFAAVSSHALVICLIDHIKIKKNRRIRSPYDARAYMRAFSFRPLYHLFIWPILGYLYTVWVHPVNLFLSSAWVGVLWMLLSIVLDAILWVVWRHRWALTPRQMYLHGQPWLLLSYLIIVIGPFIGAMCL